MKKSIKLFFLWKKNDAQISGFAVMKKACGSFPLRLFSGNVNASGVVTCSNLLKKSFRKTSLFVLTVTGVLEKVFC